MLRIQGTLQIIPVSVQTESGTLRVDDSEGEQPAVVQTFITMNGPVQVVFPVDSVEHLIDGLRQAKAEAEKNTPAAKGSLYVPSSMEEAEHMAKAQEQLTLGDNDAPSGT